MLPNDLTSFISYFRTLAEKHKGINDFVHGNSARIVSESRDGIAYPCLWLETPVMTIVENGAENMTGNREGALVVLTNADLSSPQLEDQAWAATERIALDILSKIRKDQRLHNFRISFKGVPLEPISTLFVDNEYGWRMEFRLENSIDLCYDPSKWDL